MLNGLKETREKEEVRLSAFMLFTRILHELNNVTVPRKYKYGDLTLSWVTKVKEVVQVDSTILWTLAQGLGTVALLQAIKH